MQLEKKLAKWATAGLISSDQVLKIRELEDREGRGRGWVVWAVASVGGLAVVAGIISLVAANWDDIPDEVKLGAGLGLLVGDAFAARAVGERGEGWMRDLLLLLHQGLVLAMIGLVAQVFHLSGHPWRPFALAFVFAIPPVVAGRRSVLADVAVYFALQSLWLWLDEVKELDFLFRSFRFPLVAASIGLLLAAAATFASNGPTGSHCVRAFNRWAFGLIALAVIVGAAGWSVHWPAYEVDSLERNWPALALLVSLAVAALAQLRPRSPAAPNWRRIEPFAAGAAVVGTLFLLGPAYRAFENHLHAQIVGFSLFCALATLFTFAAGAQGSQWGVNVGSVALAVRILALFMELFENLTKTGIGLIITGFLLVAIAYGWWRLRGAVPIAGRNAEARQDGAS